MLSEPISALRILRHPPAQSATRSRRETHNLLKWQGLYVASGFGILWESLPKNQPSRALKILSDLRGFCIRKSKSIQKDPVTSASCRKVESPCPRGRPDPLKETPRLLFY